MKMLLSIPETIADTSSVLLLLCIGTFIMVSFWTIKGVLLILHFEDDRTPDVEAKIKAL